MKDKLLIGITLTLILFFGIVSPVIGLLGSKGIIENRLLTKNLIITENYYDDDYPGASVLNKIEDIKTDIKNIYSNCIPMYSLLVNTVQQTDVKLMNFSDGIIINTFKNKNTAIEDNDIQTVEVIDENTDTLNESIENVEKEENNYVEIPIDFSSYTATRLSSGRPNIFSIEPMKVLERVEAASDKEFERLLERELKYLDRLYNVKPELNYYIYMGTRLQESEFFSEIVKKPRSTYEYFRRFVEELNPAYKFDYLHLDTPDDRINKQYRTDHHWNMFGAYEGYQQIINMMYEDIPEIGKPVEYNIVKIEGLKWFGSMSAGVTDEEYLDDFYVLDLSDLPKYTGNDYNIKQVNRQYMKGNYPKNGNLYTDYYGAYYPPQERYTFSDNNTGRNLLLIGDSYSWSVAPIIAAHFDNTYCYNKPWMVDGVKYDYEKILEENEITDVLILLYSSRLLFGYDSTDFDNFLD